MRSVTSPSRAGDSTAPGPAPGWRGVDWRAHQRWLTVDGSPLNVVDVGSGPPVVFIHGLGGSWPNWIAQLPALATSHRAIALDLPGFGHSPLPPHPISIPSYAECVAGLIDRLEIPSAAVVGNSMGGEIAVHLALARPQLVERLVLISPAGISTGALAPRMGLIRMLHPAVGAAGRLVAANARTIARRPWLRSAALSVVAAKPRRIPPDLALEQLSGMGKPGFMPALEAIVSDSQSFASRLSSVTCPTLVVWGQEDPLIPVRDADTFETQIPEARKIIWQGTGHVAMFERPPEFNALLEGFLSG